VSLTRALLTISLLGGSAVCSSEGNATQLVGTADLPRLGSVKAIEINYPTRSIKYVPLSASFVDQDKKPAAPVLLKLPNGGLVISGRIAFLAADGDRAALLDTVRRDFGPEATIEPLHVESVGIWMYTQGSLVWSLPSGAALMNSVPFQLAIASAPRGVITLLVARVVQWEDMLPPAPVRILINWSAVASALSTEFNSDGVVGVEEISSFEQRVRDSGAVKGVAVDGDHPLGDAVASEVDLMVRDRITRRFFLTVPSVDTSPVAVVPPLNPEHLPLDPESATSSSLRYRRLAEVEHATGQEILDLTSSTSISRTIITSAILTVSTEHPK